MNKTIKLNDLRVGDVVLYPPHEGDWLAQAIALLTAGTVNHAAVYYGVKDGKHSVAESVLVGMGINPLPETIEERYALQIMRHKTQTNLQPVIECAIRYINENNPYPYVNLGILALLLISKNFTKDTLKSKILYNIALLVCIKLMKTLQSLRSGQHPMSCSQFTAQCFTDAGCDYDLKFDKLIVQLDKLLAKKSQNSQMSLFDMIEMEEAQNDLLSDVFDIDLDQEEECVANEDQIAAEFLQMLQSEVPEQNSVGFKALNASNKPISPVIRKIIFMLFNIITGKVTDNIVEAIDGIKMSTNRNFLVTPEDININCNNLDHIGYLSY